MEMGNRWFRRRRGKDFEEGLSAELAEHVELEADRLEAEGLPRVEALRRARLALGGIAQIQEDCRDARPLQVFDTLWREVRESARALRRQPGFALIATCTLALGIGASAAVFSVVHGILLKPLDDLYPDASRIAMLWRTWPISSDVAGDELPWELLSLDALTTSARSFEAIGAFKAAMVNLTGVGDPERLDGTLVSRGFFPALGVRPRLGRVFTAEEDSPGGPRVAVVSDAFYRERLGSDPAAVGREIALDGEKYTVVGVMPPGFDFPRGEEMPNALAFPRRPRVWLPLALPPPARGPSELAVVARLRPEASLANAQAELDLLEKRLDREIPEGKGWWGSRVKPLPLQAAGDTRRPLWLMFGAVCAVLLIASANVASLVLTRSLARAHDLNLRRALGASRGRLALRSLVDSSLLAGVGGLLGLAIARGCLRLLAAYGPANVPRLRDVSLDGSVLLFALGVTTVAAVLVGLIPAVAAAGGRLFEALKSGGRRGAGHGRGAQRLQDAILIGEIALALVLVIATGLLARTLVQMLRSERGFDAQNVLTFQLTLPASRYPDPDTMAIAYDRALGAIRALPGVRSAGLVSAVPMGGAPDSTAIRIPGRPVGSDPQEQPFANYSFASPAYFAAIGARLRVGREFLDTDGPTSAPVAIINEAMAAKYFPGVDPLGRQVGVLTRKWPVRTIVGVVEDVKHYSLKEVPAPEMYVPYAQNEIKTWPSMRTLQAAVRADVSSEALLDGVRRALKSVDADLPVARASTLMRLVDDATAPARFSVLLLAAFGGLAFVLATVGMYGVVSYSVVQRSREIGVRMALGARRGQVFAMVVGQGSRLAAAGIVLGVLAALATTRLLGGLLYGVAPTDPLTFAAVAALLMAVAILACVIPARRATRVDPLIALRGD
jgi:predicted permease